ncbi:MAG: thioredoxin family protein [Bacteroidetes bacterium B1(2017)]|nr:MAG: thioredoxin family protein [Bacteroidetes bacterium B1(2017)]
MKNHLLIFLFSLAFVFNSKAQVTTTSTLKPGDSGIDFNLKGVDGKMHSLANMSENKGFIIVFTCNHCPFSQAYEERIIAIHSKYSILGMPVIAINPNDAKRQPEDSYKNMIKRSKEHAYAFNYLVDPTQSIAKAYGATRTPHVFVLDSTLKVIYVGAIDDNFEEPKEVKEKYLEAALDAYLANIPISISQTKAIGCGIKWKLD